MAVALWGPQWRDQAMAAALQAPSMASPGHGAAVGPSMAQPGHGLANRLLHGGSQAMAAALWGPSMAAALWVPPCHNQAMTRPKAPSMM